VAGARGWGTWLALGCTTHKQEIPQLSQLNLPIQAAQCTITAALSINQEAQAGDQDIIMVHQQFQWYDVPWYDVLQ
jgi:hypothetical protein